MFGVGGQKSGDPELGLTSRGRASFEPHGKTLRQVAAELGVGAATLHRALAGGVEGTAAE